MSRYELSKYDFAIALAALRSLRHALTLTHRITHPTTPEGAEIALYIQRADNLIDRLDLAHTAFIELED